MDPYRAWLQAHLGKPLDDSPSGLARWLAPTLTAFDDEGLTLTFVVRPEMTNAANVLHGGIVAAMLDEVMGMTVFVYSQGRYHASVNLNINYLLAGQIGDRIVARSHILRMGRRIVSISATLHSANGALMAHATSNLIAIDTERT
jgi:uncharacterized protein (TIGR00369 family)